MRLCIFARFCAFLCVSLRFPLPKWAVKKREFAQNSEKNVQKVLLCNTPFSYTPFCVSPRKGNQLPRRDALSQKHCFFFIRIMENQAVLDGVPPTGLQLLRSERVLLTL